MQKEANNKGQNGNKKQRIKEQYRKEHFFQVGSCKDQQYKQTLAKRTKGKRDSNN